MKQKKSYINMMADIQRDINKRGPVPIIREVYKTNFGGDYCILHLLYEDVWYGCMWLVEYKFLDGILLNSETKCVGGAAIHTERENDYPKLSEEKIKEYYKIALEEYNKKLNVQRSSLDEGGESLNVEP